MPVWASSIATEAPNWLFQNSARHHHRNMTKRRTFLQSLAGLFALYAENVVKISNIPIIRGYKEVIRYRNHEGKVGAICAIKRLSDDPMPEARNAVIHDPNTDAVIGYRIDGEDFDWLPPYLDEHSCSSFAELPSQWS